MKTDYYDGANLRLATRIPPTAQRILDVGCAAGKLGEYLKKQRPDRIVWGIEKVPEVAGRAAKVLDRVINGDLDRGVSLPCPPGFFDCILCGDVLEHLRDPEAVLSRLGRFLKADGLLVCSVPNIAHWSVLTELLRGRFTYADSGLLDRTHLRFFTPTDFRALLHTVGFTVVTEEAVPIVEESILDPLCKAAASLGIDPHDARRSLSTYQMVFAARKETTPPNLFASPVPHAGYTIIILTFNSLATLPACLGTLLPTLGSNDELILVDNASTDGTAEHLRQLEGIDPRLHIYFNDRNLGYSAGCNVGIRAARNESLVLLNPDTLVWPGWLERLRACFHEPSVGAVGPISNYVAGDQFVGFHLPPNTTGALPSHDIVRLIQQANKGRCVETKLLIGFCMMLRRSILNSVGMLDEALFLGSDDLELSWRLRRHGYKLLIASDVYVEHRGGVSFAALPSQEKQRLLTESTRALAQKLESVYGIGQVPGSIDLWGIDIFKPE